MAIEGTLQRVEAELAAGDVEKAQQRLRGLVSTYPARLDLRARLADTHRRLGDRVQAGRWDYLSDGRDPAEVAAFEDATPSAVDRMRALAWREAPRAAATGTARARLEELLERARQETGRAGLTCAALAQGRWSPPAGPDRGERLVVAGLLALLALFLVGVVDGVRVVLRFLASLSG
ncbi:DUF6584 family protein [Kineococcus sp. NUM-3379]